MTALAQYQRLEAAGTWRPSPQAQRRDVIVSFGDATLVLSDPRSEVPLSHWSLPAVTRLNPGRAPALYAPDAAGGEDEQLEIADELMIEAIERVHRAIARARPHPGRLRGGLMLGIAALIAALAVWWLPDATLRHAARIAPPAQRAEIGGQVLAELVRVTGAPCRRPAADVVLERLAARVLPQGGRVAVLPQPFSGARALPGGIVVIGQDLMQPGQTGQWVALGHILAAAEAAAQADPLLAALDHAGFAATLRLLTTGALPGDALDGYAEALLAAPPPAPAEYPLLARFAVAGVPSEPYARALDPSGEATLALIEADPFRTALPEATPLSPEEWEALIAICDG